MATNDRIIFDEVLKVVVFSQAGKATPSPSELAKFQVAKTDDVLLKATLSRVMSEHDARGGTDQVAKGAELHRAADALLLLPRQLQ